MGLIFPSESLTFPEASARSLLDAVMPSLYLFEDDQVAALRPLVNTRAVYDLRLAIRSLLETTRDAFAQPATMLHVRAPLADVTAHHYDFPVNTPPPEDGVLLVNGRFVATEGPALDRLRRAVRERESARAFVAEDTLVAAWLPDALAVPDALATGDPVTPDLLNDLPMESVEDATCISRMWHLLDALAPALERDFAARTGPYNILETIHERPDASVHPSAIGVRPEQIYIAPGATIRPGAILNAESGPIYIDRSATVMEQAVVRGPAYIGRKAQVKIGANIGTAAIGTYSKVGGEVHDTVIHSYSNKAHAGFLGHAYLGRWCNLGADTNNSDLKNDYGSVSVYNVATGAVEDTGRQFVGLFMGDHSKTGINVSLNTGTVIGTFCNVYGSGLPPRFLPSFSWGTAEQRFTTYRLEKALRVAEAVMARRDHTLTDADRALLTHVFEQTQPERERHL